VQFVGVTKPLGFVSTEVDPRDDEPRTSDGHVGHGHSAPLPPPVSMKQKGTRPLHRDRRVAQEEIRRSGPTAGDHRHAEIVREAATERRAEQQSRGLLEAHDIGAQSLDDAHHRCAVIAKRPNVVGRDSD
jgi:hypothetical protein